MTTTKQHRTKSDDATQGLNERTIQQHVGDRSYHLGEEYFESGMVLDCRRDGLLLKARCHGRSADHYNISARVAGDRIEEAECSCPVGGGGYCKHVAAVLLAWLQSPEEFREVEPLSQRLSACKKSQLIELIEQMLEREPDLESWFELALPTVAPSNSTVSADDYCRRTVEAFESAGYGWEADRQLAASVEGLRKIGDQFCNQKNFTAASAVYSGILDGFCSAYESFHDESGNVICGAGECITALGECLPHLAEETDSRSAALRALFDVLRFDIEFGDTGLSDCVPDILLKQTTSEERAEIADWIRELDYGDNSFGSHWTRNPWGGLLLELEGEPEDDEAYLQHCREYGLKGEFVERLLERGRLDEALEEINASNDYELMGHANRLVDHDHVDLAQELVWERVSSAERDRNKWQLRDWLKRFYQSRKDWNTLLQLCVDEFNESPCLSTYQEIRQYAKKIKSWSSLRPELMARIPRDSDELIRIHLDEGETDEAIKLFESRPKNRSHGLRIQFRRLDLELAEAAEKSHPETALKFYQAEVNDLIDARGRQNYQSACEYLKKIRRLYKKLKRTEDWKEYLEKLRAENRALRALKEELANAGL